MTVLASAEFQMCDGESCLLQFGGNDLFLAASFRLPPPVSLPPLDGEDSSFALYGGPPPLPPARRPNYLTGDVVCAVRRREMCALVSKIPYDCGGSVEGKTRASAGAREGIPPTRRQCCARYKFSLEIATRRRFSLGRTRIATTFHPNWRQYSGKSSTLFYSPARECDDVLVCFVPTRRRSPDLFHYLRFDANNKPLEGGRALFSAGKPETTL